MKEERLLSAILVTAMIAVGCSSNGGVGEEDAGNDEISIGSEESEVELSFWAFGTNYDSLIEEYTEENPNVTISIQQVDMEDHHTSLFTSLSAGAGAPDIAAIERSEIDSYKRAEDKFMNLYDLGASDLESDYLDWAWEIGSSVDGDFLLGVPADIEPTAMYYRADVFEQAGLPSEPEEVEEMIQTWEDYRQIAATILDKTGKKMVDNSEPVFKAKRDQASEHYFNETNELLIESSPYMKQVYDETARWIEAGYIDNSEMGSREWRNAIQEGDYATLLGPVWMSETIKGYAPDDTNWRVVSMPEGAGNWGGSWFTIPKETDHPEEAYEFLTWLVAAKQQMKSFEERGTFPSTPDVYDDPDFTLPTDDHFGGGNVAELFAEAALEVEYVYKGSLYEDVNEEILIGLDNVYDGANPEEEWPEIINRVERRVFR
ncbi:sugar transporter [Salipaludibacillus keqinensis]|uniref:Sugar transporter n=1 Tax=Salipaludibacillus keqinensis TaxID=2045207 RepID=A0A323T8V9_9BACI|nr:ABC transporter substrate-binding protein [Salipaludibacillus keqinensis]PYZ91919.1 sugar transporter [Salipaludibacillus keqinensis]